MDAASMWRLVMQASETCRQIELMIFNEPYGTPRYEKARRLRSKADARWSRRFKRYCANGRAA